MTSVCIVFSNRVLAPSSEGQSRIAAIACIILGVLEHSDQQLKGRCTIIGTGVFELLVHHLLHAWSQRRGVLSLQEKINEYT